MYVVVYYGKLLEKKKGSLQWSQKRLSCLYDNIHSISLHENCVLSCMYIKSFTLLGLKVVEKVKQVLECQSTNSDFMLQDLKTNLFAAQ